MAKPPVWYRHRIVKRMLLPGVRSAGDPQVEIAKKTLLQQADIEMVGHSTKYHPGQILITKFVKPRLGGVEVFVASTLYGPPSVEDEIISELAKRGEA